MTTSGIDVSHHNSVIDWPKVAADGVDFAFIKCTDGPNGRDPMFHTNLHNARAAGLLVGAYHFARPNGSAAQQAQRFLDNGGGEDGILCALDYEVAPFAEHWAIDWLERVEGVTGRTPFLYCSQSMRSSLDAGERFPRWVARYGPTPPSDPFVIWQHSDLGAVDGITGHVDLNTGPDNLADYLGGQSMYFNIWHAAGDATLWLVARVKADAWPWARWKIDDPAAAVYEAEHGAVRQEQKPATIAKVPYFGEVKS